MRKDRLYFFTFLSISVIFIVIASIAIQFFVKASANQLLETQLESSKREAKEIAFLMGFQLENGIPKETVIHNVQRSIESTNLNTGFVSVFDWSGREVCHPDIKRVGQLVSPNQSFVSSVTDDLNSNDFYILLKNKEEAGGVRNFENSEQESEVIYLYPVANSDWIIAAHANTNKILEQIDALKNKFYNILLIMGFIIILASVITVRLIGSAYEKRLELKNQKLEDEVINLSKLNAAVGDYQQKVSENLPEQPKDKQKEKNKKRILTYVRNELLPIATEDIAHIYMEHTITYVVCFDGKRSTTNVSLDELYSNLDSAFFYRANRQFIIAISGIDKIVKYGNNQLKILVNPNSEVDIIISKNKAAEFKQWLNL
ncbi:MAG: transcriptional regulator [Flavobacteriaceae bacterium]|nr:MAG: transcriptional regulator [Flavobacteriaceae bacterium]